MKYDPSKRFVSRLTRDTQALILAGGRGSRLHHLTTWRAKPAVPFGGKFRIIDFPLSNCVNSGIRRISVLTQYKAHSLIRHIQQGWGFLRGEFNEYVALLPAQQRIETSWYKGTADAVYQNLDIIQDDFPAYILILAGDHIYKMDYGSMIAMHSKNDADLTVGCIEVPLDTARGFGVMSVDENDWIECFDEKPEHPRPLANDPEQALASMGIYIFNTDYLIEILTKDAEDSSSHHDFGMNIIPAALEAGHKVLAYPFRGLSKEEKTYWRDVGTVDAYWQANLELTGITPELNLYENEWPIWTYQVQAPPAKFIFDDEDRRGMAVDSMVSGGCIISGATVRHSLLFTNVSVEANSVIEDSVILPDVSISEDCRISRAVIDTGCYIPPGTVIGKNAEQDAERFYISPGGIVLVTREMLGQETRHVR